MTLSPNLTVGATEDGYQVIAVLNGPSAKYDTIKVGGAGVALDEDDFWDFSDAQGRHLGTGANIITYDFTVPVDGLMCIDVGAICFDDDTGGDMALKVDLYQGATILRTGYTTLAAAHVSGAYQAPPNVQFRRRLYTGITYTIRASEISASSEINGVALSRFFVQKLSE